MNPQRFYLKEKDQTVHTMTPVRLAIHVPCSIIEATNDDGQLYHLYFDDRQFLAAKKVSRSRLGSYTEKAFTQGIVFLYPHPISDMFVHPESTVLNRSFTSLLQVLQHQKDPVKTAELFSCFDGLIKEEKLFKVIRDCFYECKREGQFKKADMILHLMKDVFPEHEWVIALRAQKLDVSETRIYQWKRRDTASFSIPYILAIKEESYRSHPSPETFNTLLTYCKLSLTADQQQQMFDSLLHAGFEEPAKELYRQYVKSEKYTEAFHTLIMHPFTPSGADRRVLQMMLKDQHVMKNIPIDKICARLVPLFHQQPDELNLLLISCLSLHYEKDFQKVLQDLEPVKLSGLSLPVYQDIERLSMIAEDPEQQALAGELYERIGYYQDALECYSYEMELNPESRGPIEKISNMYLIMGQAEEAKVYRQLLDSMP
ncbi:hypothetical protein [Jeotgalibacillus aurantiacus]|uniref:hypothetical protein n=1 Tax=Jeotgalibacillus aurantiacus TaxID=2763266 RepID=UPI001D0B0643|nr:hypothetical protein [Jeotgalibacillus aurantiacus]